MPVQLSEGTVLLTAVVTVDDAEPLAQWLRETAATAVDLTACTHLHTAALQALLAGHPVIAAAPADPFLARWILPLLAGPSATEPDPAEVAR